MIASADDYDLLSSTCWQISDPAASSQCENQAFPTIQGYFDSVTPWKIFTCIALVAISLFCLFVLSKKLPQLKYAGTIKGLSAVGIISFGLLAIYFAATLHSIPFTSIDILLFMLTAGIFFIPLKKQTSAQLTQEPERVLTKEEQEQYTHALQAVQSNPQSYEAWADLGYIQHKVDKNEDALVSANKAISLNKIYARAWMVRGAALSTMDGEEDDALVALEEALGLDSNNVDALYYKGRVYTFQERDSLAHQMFDRVLARDPTYKDALVSKGALYLAPDILDDEHFNGALATADKLIRRFPDDALGWRMQGTAYQFRGEQRGVEPEERLNLLSNALASFNMALEIDPTDSNTYLLKAGPYAVLGDYGNALDALNQGLKIDPTNTRLQEAKADIVGKRTKETASKVAGTAGRMALGGGLGLAKGSGRVGKMFWDVFKDDMRKP